MNQGSLKRRYKHMLTSKRTVLVTGGSGFIGSEFLRQVVNDPKYKDYHFINLDALLVWIDPDALKGLGAHDNYTFIDANLTILRQVEAVFDLFLIDDVIHFAAQSDVDKSISNPEGTVSNNVLGTLNLLDVFSRRSRGRFVYVSTDEVYGPSGPSVRFKESDEPHTTNPYSASKLASEALVRAYANTFKMDDYVITRGANTFGPWQHPTKLIPLSVKRLVEGGNIGLYGDGSATREWLPVEDHAAGIRSVWENGVSGSIYNIGTGVEFSGNEIAEAILEGLKIKEDRVEYIKDRPGHDKAYAMDNSRIIEEGLFPTKYSFGNKSKHKIIRRNIMDTARWYKKYYGRKN